MFVTATGQSLFSNVGNTLRTGGSSSGLAGAHSIANPSGLSSIGNGRSGAGLGVSVGLKHVSVVNNGNAVDGDGGASGGLGVGGLGVGRGSGGGDGGGRREDIGGADSGANVGRLDADKSILEGGNVNTQQSDEGRFAIGSILMPEKNAAREQQ